MHQIDASSPQELSHSGRVETVLRNQPLGMRAKDLSFLLEATQLLAQSLEIETTLKTVARLSLPHLGSWCIVDVCEGDHMRRLTIAHPVPERQAVANQLLLTWPPQLDDPVGAPLAVRTRRSQVITMITDDLLVNAARSPENLVLLRHLEMGSIMTIPLLVRGEVIGAITYVSSHHGDSFTEQDLVLAEDLAGRCATAIDNSRLLQATQQAQTRAEEARAKAETANLVKMRFLATMSHELRTPLNAIAGYAQLLELGLRGPLNQTQLTDLRRIQANQRHLLSLVESVLSYAKIDAGQVDFGLEDVSLASVLTDVDRIISPLAAEKRIIYLVCKSQELHDVTVHADPGKLRQILINLLANAIKFSSENTKIELKYQVVAPLIEIRVSDTGIGIAPEYQKRIFDPFVQVDEDLTHIHGGTGLGLAISRELTIGMGGNLSVESELGRGSIFTLTLPQGRS